MKNPTRLLLAGFAIAISATVLTTHRADKSTKGTAEEGTRSTSSKLEVFKTPIAPTLSERTASGTHRGRLLPYLQGSFSLREPSGIHQMEVAQDEVYVASKGGMRTGLRKLSAPKAGDALLREAEGLGAHFIVYPTGMPRTEDNRRILTDSVLISAADAKKAQSLAATVNAAGLAKAEVQTATPRHVVATRKGLPGSALLLLADLEKSGIAADAELQVLLASRLVAAAAPNDPLFNQQWYLKNSAVNGADINTVTAWDAYRGNGVTVCIMDDAIQTNHPDLMTNYVETWSRDYIGGDFVPDPFFYDPVLGDQGDNHGTAVAGMAVARGNNGQGISGAAPEASWSGIRLLGTNQPANVVAHAMGWNNDKLDIKVCSWGPPDNLPNALGTIPSIIRDAINEGAKTGRSNRGTLFVFAAGNGRVNGMQGNKNGYANNMCVTAVSAVGSSGQLAPYSAFGAHIVASAPSSSNSSDRIVTTDRSGVPGYNTGSTPGELPGQDYTQLGLNGTSAAAPLVGGVMALMLQANPNLGWRDVQEILLRSGKQLSPSDTDWVTRLGGRNNLPRIKHHHQYGGGLVDAQAATTMAVAWANLPPMVSVSRSFSGTQVVPDNSTTGASLTMSFAGDSPIRVEHVEVTLDMRHSNRGDVEIQLVSPVGVVSQLAAVAPADDGAVDWPSGAPVATASRGYSSWIFSTVRHWGESSLGNWTVVLRDRQSGNTGTVTAASIKIHGSPSIPAGIGSPPPAPVMVRAGETASFNVIATGTPEFTYQWSREGTPIAGATGETYTKTNAALTDAGTHSVVLGNITGTANVTTALGVVTTAPTTATAILSTSKTLTVNAAGPGLTYTWKRAGIDLVNNAKFNGVSTNSLTIANIAVADDSSTAGPYECFVSTNGSVSRGAGPTLLTVLLPPQVSTAPLSQVILQGNPLNLSVDLIDTTGVTYQWRKGTVNINGATTNGFSKSAVVLGDAGAYTVTMTNSVGPTSATASVAVVSRAPATAAVVQGSPIVLNASASGSNLTYQWRRNGIPLSDGGSISGSSTSQLTITGSTPSDMAEYDVVVSMPGATPLSAGPTVLTVLTTPVVSSAPASTVVLTGSPASFTVIPTQTQNMSYQWRKGTVNIVGATEASFVKSGTTLADAGTYTVTLSNPAGSTTANANLGVIQASPPTADVVKNGSIVLTCVAAGPGLTYEWRRNGSPLFNDGHFSGVTTRQLTIVNVTDADGGAPGYECFVSVTGSPTTGAGATVVNVLGAPTVAAAPDSQIFYQGEPISLTVEPTNPLGISYVWKKGTTPIIGATAATYTKANALLTDAGSYSVTMTNLAGTISSSANVGVVQRAPSDVPTVIGGTASITINAAGSGLVYQWYRGGAPLSNGGNIAGVTTRTLTITGVTQADTSSGGGDYECYVQITGSDAVSAGPTNLRVLSTPAVSGGLGSVNAPQNQVLWVGENLTIAVVPEDPFGITYQWKKGSTNIPGATASTYQKNNVSLTDAGIYSVTLTNLAGSLTVAAQVAVAERLPTTSSINLGGTIRLNANVTGTGLTYQWCRNGQPLTNGGNISGATSATLVITGVTQADFDAGEYEVKVTFPGVSQPRSLGITTLTPVRPPQIASPMQDRIALTGTESTFTTVPTDPALITYSWTKTGTPIAGATQATYVRNVTALSDAGTYAVKLINPAGQITDDAVLMVVQRAPVRVTVIPGGPLVLNAALSVPQGTAVTYQWKRNGTPLANGNRISGVTTNQLAISGFTPADASPSAGLYEVELTINGTSVSPGTTEAVMLTPPTIEVDGQLDNGTSPGEGYTVGIPMTINFLNGGATRWLITNLPAGLTYDPLNGRISGIPTRAVTNHPVYVTAYNAAGSTQGTIYLTIVPFPANLVGTYDGLLSRLDGANQKYGGEISITIGTTGAMTGRFLQGRLSTSTSFVGSLEMLENGKAGATFAVPISGGVAQSITYVLDPAVGQISGTLRQPGLGGWDVSIEAWKRIYSVSRPATDLAGTHNYWLEPPGGLSISAAQGGGSGIVIVYPDGRTRIEWNINKYAQAPQVRTPYVLAGGRIPCHLIMPTEYSSLHGWFVITDQGATLPNLVGGNMEWYYGLATWTRIYGESEIGINTTGPLSVVGSQWTAPARGAVMSGINANLRFSFTGVNIESSASISKLHNPFRVVSAGSASNAQKITFPSGNLSAFALTADPVTGRIRGTATVVDGTVQRPLYLNAYYSAHHRRGGGYFRMPLLPVTRDSNGVILHATGFVEILELE
jgi:subtilisin-like proprotein convertase family protein